MSTTPPPKTLKQKAERVLEIAFRGLHNVPGKVVDNGRHIKATIFATLATTDFDNLTRIVIAAHDECVRVEVQPCNPQYLRLLFHDRTRDSDSTQSHLTMSEAISKYRINHPEPQH